MIIKRTEIVIECWRDGNRFYKRLPKYNADNEMYFLKTLQWSGYVPRSPSREGIELISMEYIESEPVTDVGKFMGHYDSIIGALRSCGIRHGDLTRYSVLVRDNRPILVDFSEARVAGSPIESKRPEGDSYWLKRTMQELAREVKV